MSQARYSLVIGNKMWSSWSLRPWLLMRQFGLPFDEIHILLRSPTTAAEIGRYSPSGKVPVLIDDGLAVWDTLAIVEYLADAHPGMAIWPREPKTRAIARAVSAEMHSGFQALRHNCPMDFCARRLEPADTSAIKADVAHIVAIWRDCRARYGSSGPFLFGDFCAADAMFAPVASRLVTYNLDLAQFGDDGVAATYGAALMALPAMADWAHDAKAEQENAQG